MRKKAGDATRSALAPSRGRRAIATIGIVFVMLLGSLGGCSRTDHAAKGKDAGAAPDEEHRHAEGDASSGHAGAGAAEELWLCPMHPTYTADRKGPCPICGMDLIPAAEFEQSGAGSSVEGMASVYLDEPAIRLAGIRTLPAEWRGLRTSIRTVGLVLPVESRIRLVRTKVSGWVERVFIQATGDEVRAGEPVVAIYSPELLAAQQELVQAIAAARAATSEAGQRSADLLVEAVRQRLRLLDVAPKQIEEIERTGQAQRTVILRAPAGGVVTAREVYEGQTVDPGSALFTITDLSEVWIEGSFYESEARFLSEGLEAEVTLPYDPTVALNGTIDFIYPFLDPQTRTVRARFVLDNSFGLLKPGMYANVSLYSELEEGVVIPDNAILDTGERAIVFVDQGEGLFAPREVEVGARAGGEALIASGVEAGENVVVRANFLLDSESRIRAVLSGARGNTPKGGHDSHPGSEADPPADSPSGAPPRAPLDPPHGDGHGGSNPPAGTGS